MYVYMNMYVYKNVYKNGNSGSWVFRKDDGFLNRHIRM